MLVLTFVGYDFSIVIGMETVNPGEGEKDFVLRLIKRLTQELGKRFIDIVIGDVAAYCSPRFFKECEKYGIVPGAVLKENQLDLLQCAIAEKKKVTLIESSGNGRQKR